ncbi:MAG: hypothetical protein LUG89_02565 [Methanosphaera sp.]|nr:hypothetical protein [Ruminococcus sp.]MCD7781566.1 hypothetical protein [Methanosphaera sp.]MCD7800578.1 hypothetical protein [Ruminococcus sp.]
MNSSKNNKTESINTNDMTKKSSLPLIVGTGAILFAGVISCDINSTAQLINVLNANALVSSQDATAQLDSEDDDSSTDNKKKSSIKSKSYFKNDDGELFYDSDAEDDEFYYGDWDRDTRDTDDDFILW